jgi:hypothetical protein
VKRWEDVATRQTVCRPKDQSEAIYIYIYTRKQAQGNSELHQNFAVYFFFADQDVRRGLHETETPQRPVGIAPHWDLGSFGTRILIGPSAQID